MAKHTNDLINESSPYLLQHAHNPVNWRPWNDETLELAKKENKPLLISIGYSSCHWCHVMEHESFEDEQVAKIMNDDFICVKVDREEHPDVDHLYMDAVQLVSGHGGWPLNCFALPDSRPFYGGTYFPKEHWINVLKKVASEFGQNHEQLEEFATKLTQGVKAAGMVEMNPAEPLFHKESIEAMVQRWRAKFDPVWGGEKQAPKFPMPINYQFFLHYAELASDNELKKHVHNTLSKMAQGGIYDQIGGGFARYSVDETWKVPHFEKMLYDNGQLLSLFSKAWLSFQNPDFKKVIYQTVDFLEREMFDTKSGAFYSALDADSEGEEGKYYIWTEVELKKLLSADEFEFAKSYYNINERGHWEDGNFILLRSGSDQDFANEHSITLKDVQQKEKDLNEKLLAEREKREKPGLDDKSLTSWNAMTTAGLVDAYTAFDEKHFLDLALKNSEFLIHQLNDDGSLWHSYKNGKSRIIGYLEDYAFTIEAFIKLHEATFEENWLHLAKKLTQYAMSNFQNKETGMFYVNDSKENNLVVQKMETQDNVIPAGNSTMAHNLYKLGKLLDNGIYRTTAETMLNNVQNEVVKYGGAYSNWALLMTQFIFPFNEIAITGERSHELRKEITQHFLPNCIITGGDEKSDLPLLRDRLVEGKSFIYVCRDFTCKLPVEKVEEALEQIG